MTPIDKLHALDTIINLKFHGLSPESCGGSDDSSILVVDVLIISIFVFSCSHKTKQATKTTTNKQTNKNHKQTKKQTTTNSHNQASKKTTNVHKTKQATKTTSPLKH